MKQAKATEPGTDATTVDLYWSFRSPYSYLALHYVRTLAQSLAPRIRVNAIAPGPTIPPPWQPDGYLDKAWARLPLKRGADPYDIADGVMHIIAMRSMTGQMLALDGGEHIEWPERRGPTPRKQ